MIPTLNIPIQSNGLKPYIFAGDTIDEIVITSDEFPDLTTATIKMDIYNRHTNFYSVSNGNGITVNSATQFTIDEVSAISNPFVEGEFIGDLEITDSNGIRKTYFRVKYIIQKQYTK